MNALKIAIALAALSGGLYLKGCSYRHVDEIKSAAPRVWDAAGYEIEAYSGYQIGDAFQAPGGKVWYVVSRKGDSRITYKGFLTKWGDEYHIYNLTALDAIGPK